MDTGTFRGYGALIVNALRSVDEALSKNAQEYIDAIVSHKEGTGSKEEVQRILDDLPETDSLAPEVISFFAELYRLSFLYSF